MMSKTKAFSKCKLKMHDQMVIIYTILQNYDFRFISLRLKWHDDSSIDLMVQKLPLGRPACSLF